jgi:PKD repeat protein
MQLPRLLISIFIFSALSGFGQTDKCRKSTEGTDFWFGFMEGRNYQVGHYNEITLSSSFTCNYTIYIGKSIVAFTSGTVLPNIPLKIRIDWKLIEATGSEKIQDKAIHLVSDNPVNIYALNWSDSSSEVALIFPATSLGSEYYTMCYTPHINGNGINSGSGRNSEFLIVASQDSTEVWITPTKVTDQGKPANVPFRVWLFKGELYQVQSENLPVPKFQGQGDLTGSYIKSNKPVALYSGSLSTTVPGDASVSAWDHLYEQMPPLQAWGRKFITVPLKTRHEDTYRILAAEDNTTVRIGIQTPFVLNKGQWKEFPLLNTEPSLIESDKPVLLAQFSNSNSVDSYFTGGDGDPFMVIISPVNQTREKVAFVAYDSPKINSKFFINVVVKDDAVGKIKLDGGIVSFVPISGTGYSCAQVSIQKGNHYIESTEAGYGFIAYVYGFGGVEAYGYGVGYNLDIVLDLGSNINAVGKLLVRCDGADPLPLNAGNAFDKYLWNTGDTTSVIQVTNSGWYKVKASVNGGCELQDSVEVQVSKPVVELGNDTTICNPSAIVLDGGTPFGSWLWKTPQTGATGQKITASKAGIYSVEAINKYGCRARDSIKVSFTNKPRLDLSALDTLICGKKSAILDVTSDKGDFTVQRLSDGFIFNNLDINVPDFGAYNLKIKATDQFSCYSDSVIKFGFRKTPTVNFSIDSTTCQHYNLDVRYSGDALIAASDFAWVFGGDTIQHGLGADAYIVPLGINRATRDLKLTVTDQGCSNSKTINDIKVIPNLNMWVKDSLGCEPFTTKFMSDNTETVTYDWDFGDGEVVHGFYTSPDHTYKKYGYYPVRLKVTTDKGCTNEVKIDKMVHVAPIPTVGFTPLPAQCLDFGDHSISYSGTGDNGDTYNWNILAFDPEEIIQKPNKTQGPFIFNLKNKPQANIGLNVISKYGCQSADATVLVKRKPDFSINPTFIAGCVPFETVLSGIINDKVDMVSFIWDFGDGLGEAGWQKTHIYDQPGKSYNITLSGTSSLTGCSNILISNDLLQTHPKPKSEFSMDNKIVYNDKPTVNFTNLSTGASEYLWNFGDLITSTDKDPKHDYSVTGYRTVLLEAINKFACTDTISHQLLVAFDRIFPPNAFSPNAPNVVDREFKLSSNGLSIEGYHLTIISRWNDIVFEARDEIKGWDGHMKNGTFAPAGVYLWTLNFTDFIGRKHHQTGTVTVVY